MAEPFRLGLGGSNAGGGRLGLIAKNVGMFLFALAVAVGLGTALKSMVGNSSTEARFYAEARVPLRAGELVTMDKIAWRSAQGRRLEGAFTSSDRTGSNLIGRRLTRPVQAGRPVPLAALASQSDAQALSLAQGEVAFVLSGAETLAVAGFVKPGDFVNVIAVLGAGRQGGPVDPSVGTVVQAARVLAVQPVPGRRDNGISIALSMSSQEAEDLAAWRYAGRLVVALAGTPDELSEYVEWRPLYEDTAESDPGLSADESYVDPVWEGGEDEAAGEEEIMIYEEPAIEVVGPSGIQTRPTP